MIAFFRQPLYELFGQSVPLDNSFSIADIRTIQEQLTERESNSERIVVLEKFLLSKLTHFKTDILISAAISKISAVEENLRIKKLAKEFYIRQDTFEKRLRKVTGATPKQFSHIIKMHSTIYMGKR